MYFIVFALFIGQPGLIGAQQNKMDLEDLLNEPAWTDKQIVEHLLKTYRFPEATTNISVAVLLEVERILNNNDDQCHLRLQLTQRWIESKLDYKRYRDSMYPIKLRSNSYIWNPSLNIENAVGILPVGKDVLRVYSNGLVEYIQRLDVTVEAAHSLTNFPFEKRNCTIKFSNDDSRAVWTRLLSVKLPIDDESLSEWQSDISATRSIAHTVHLRLRRSVFTWYCFLFGPTFGFAMASFLSLCLTRYEKFGRVMLNTTVFVAILTLSIINIANIPKTQYLKAIDQWILAVSMFSFLNLVQVVFETPRKSSRNQKSPKRDESEEQTYWISDRPYYSQLPEGPFHFAIRNCILKTITLVCLVAFVIYFIMMFIYPFSSK